MCSISKSVTYLWRTLRSPIVLRDLVESAIFATCSSLVSMSSSKSSRNSLKRRIFLFLTPLLECLSIPSRNIVLRCWVNPLINGDFSFILPTLATSELSSILILTIYTFNINFIITRQVLKLLSKISKNLPKEERKVLLLMASKLSWTIVVASRVLEVIQFGALRIWAPRISNSSNNKSTTPI